MQYYCSITVHYCSINSSTRARLECRTKRKRGWGLGFRPRTLIPLRSLCLGGKARRPSLRRCPRRGAHTRGRQGRHYCSIIAALNRARERGSSGACTLTRADDTGSGSETGTKLLGPAYYLLAADKGGPIFKLSVFNLENIKLRQTSLQHCCGIIAALTVGGRQRRHHVPPRLPPLAPPLLQHCCGIIAALLQH